MPFYLYINALIGKISPGVRHFLRKDFKEYAVKSNDNGNIPGNIKMNWQLYYGSGNTFSA